MTNAEAIKALTEMGAKNERREDDHGQTRSGWWLDGVWLAPSAAPKDAVSVVGGN
jgi:hypothetical protein